MKVLVIGDSCEDIFLYGKIERVSPEAPVPVIEPIDKTTNIGMAGNVANNLSSLGVDCDLATNTSKITKTRFIDSKSNQMLLRLDENDNLPIDDNYDRIYSSYNFRTRAYDPANKDQDYYLKNTSYGGEIQLNSTVKADNKDHKLTYGVDYSSFDTLRLQTTIDNLAGSTDVAKYNPDTVTQKLGVYIQDEFSSGKFDFIAGVRYDNYDLDATSDAIFQDSGNGDQIAADHSSDAFSPSLVASYNWSPELSSYVKYAKGFRSPSFQNINSARNPGYYTTLSNPNLKAENSDTYEIGLKRNTNPPKEVRKSESDKRYLGLSLSAM